MQKCLMIKTQDHRQFFTEEDNYIPLIEFSKTFKAEISVVRLVEPTQLLNLAELAPAICDHNYKTIEIPQYELVEVKLPTQNRPRQNILKIAAKIQKFIHDRLKTGKTISLAELKQRYAEELSVPALCNHIRKAKADLEKQGHRIVKIGGAYRMQPAQKKLDNQRENGKNEN